MFSAFMAFLVNLGAMAFNLWVAFGYHFAHGNTGWGIFTLALVAINLFCAGWMVKLMVDHSART